MLAKLPIGEYLHVVSFNQPNCKIMSNSNQQILWCTHSN